MRTDEHTIDKAAGAVAEAAAPGIIADGTVENVASYLFRAMMNLFDARANIRQYAAAVRNIAIDERRAYLFSADAQFTPVSNYDALCILERIHPALKDFADMLSHIIYRLSKQVPMGSDAINELASNVVQHLLRDESVLVDTGNPRPAFPEVETLYFK